MMHRLHVEHLSFSYGTSRVVDDVSLHVNRGEFVGIIGPNGSGKSTILKNLYRALKPQGGNASLDGENLFAMRAKDAAKKIAVIGQENDLTFEFTVEEVVAMGRTPHKRFLAPDTQEDYDIVRHSLEHLGMEHMAKRSFLNLSGGEKQRVLLARMMAQQTDFMLLDEPTNHLDVNYQLQIFNFIKRLNITVLAAIHDLNMAALYCDRLYVLDGGKIVAQGTPYQVLSPTLLKDVFGAEADVQIHSATGKLNITYIPTHTRGECIDEKQII